MLRSSCAVFTVHPQDLSALMAQRSCAVVAWGASEGACSSAGWLPAIFANEDRWPSSVCHLWWDVRSLFEDQRTRYSSRGKRQWRGHAIEDSLVRHECYQQKEAMLNLFHDLERRKFQFSAAKILTCCTSDFLKLNTLFSGSWSCGAVVRTLGLSSSTAARDVIDLSALPWLLPVG